MSIQKNLITLCFATVFTLGLAACGSDATVNGNGNERTATETATEMKRTLPQSRNCSRRRRSLETPALPPPRRRRMPSSRDGGLGPSLRP